MYPSFVRIYLDIGVIMVGVIACVGYEFVYGNESRIVMSTSTLHIPKL